MRLLPMGIEKMLDLAYEHRLIDDYRLSPSTIQVVLENHALHLDPEEARFFLQGLLIGRLRAASAGSAPG